MELTRNCYVTVYFELPIRDRKNCVCSVAFIAYEDFAKTNNTILHSTIDNVPLILKDFYYKFVPITAGKKFVPRIFLPSCPMHEFHCFYTCAHVAPSSAGAPANLFLQLISKAKAEREISCVSGDQPLLTPRLFFYRREAILFASRTGPLMTKVRGGSFENFIGNGFPTAAANGSAPRRLRPISRSCN